MSASENQYTFDRVVRMALTAGVAVAVFALIRHLSDVLIPFAAAVVLAYLINPLVGVFERRTKRRGPAVALTLSGLAIAGVATVALIVPLSLSQIDRFRADVAKLQADLAASFRPAAAQTADGTPAGTTPVDATKLHKEGETSESDVVTPLGWQQLKEGWSGFRRDAATRPRAERLASLRRAIKGTYIGDLVEDGVRFLESDEFRALVLRLAKQAALGGWEVLGLAVNFVLGLVGLVIVLLYLVFLLLDFPEYARTWSTFLPPQYRLGTVDFFAQFAVAMRRYFRGQAVVALLSGAMFSVGFSLIGLPMAVPFGVFVGLLNMVPYLQAVGLVPALLFAVLRAIERDAALGWSVGLTLLVFVIVQTIQETLVAPRVVGQATGLRPIAILLGVFIWGKLLGFLGLLLAIPLTCLGIAYYRRYVLQVAASPPGLPPSTA